MDILIIDQCSKKKTIETEQEPLTAAEIDEHDSLDALRSSTELPLVRAQQLYGGRQQQYITQAVKQLQEKTADSVERYFISAGFGLVAADEKLPPYNVTFTDYTDSEIRERASKLGIEADILEIVNQDFDIIFFALGSDYYKTFDIPSVLATVPEKTSVVLFNQEEGVKELDNAISLPARTEQAKEYGTIVVALKGKYIQHFAEHRANGTAVPDIQTLQEWCMEPYTSQSNFSQYNEN